MIGKTLGHYQFLEKIGAGICRYERVLEHFDNFEVSALRTFFYYLISGRPRP